MLAVLLETEARRPRRGAGMAIAVAVHALVAVAVLRGGPREAIALPKPDEVTLHAPVMPRPVAPPAAASARSAAAAPVPHSAAALPVVAPVEVAVGLPPVDLARGAGEVVELGGRPVGDGVGAGVAPTAPAGDRPFAYTDVDRPAVALAGNPPPAYPEALRRAALDGEVVVQFVVDTLGRAEPGSLVVVRASHPVLAEAVAAVLPRWRFAPAEAGGRRVRMVVRQPVAFGVTR